MGGIRSARDQRVPHESRVFRSRVLVYSKYGVCITLVYSQDALFVVITLINCRFCINNKLQMSTHIPGVREISPWGLELRIK